MKKIAMMVLFMGLSSEAMAGFIPIGSYTQQTIDGINLTTNSSGAVTNQVVEGFLGISSLDGFEGSAIKGSAYLQAGQVFSFDWTFSSYWNPDSSLPYYNADNYIDFSFVNLNFDGADTFETLALASSLTKSGKFEWTAAQAGILNFGIGVMDVGGKKDDSSLVISNLNPVPLPAAVWLFISGLLGFVGLRRKTTA